MVSDFVSNFIGLGAFLLAIVGPVLLALKVHRARRAQLVAAASPSPPPPPPLLPYRTAGATTVEYEAMLNEALAGWRTERERAEKYLHAIEAVATLNQDQTAQRIARQALGRN
jgi:hypothetical protein